MKIAELRNSLGQNEAEHWATILWLKQSNIQQLLKSVMVFDLTQAINRGVAIIRQALAAFASIGLDFEQFEPGHGSGHIRRDYLNALRVLSKVPHNPKEVFVGLVAGVLHDISCGVVPRYAESKRAVRHAEAGAIMILELAKAELLSLNEEEAQLIAYAIAAHTHYLKPSKVICGDAVEREITPYRDTNEAGQPYRCIWYPRQIDRLDINGPTFVGRHFLTLGVAHEDFSGDRHYDVVFENHMQPFLRSPEQIKEAGGNRTMAEHLKMFADSQTDTSVYGLWDFGRMKEIRDRERIMLDEIVEATQTTDRLFDSVREVVERWRRFLSKNIEPTAMGAKTAAQLCEMFMQLDSDAKISWCNAFHITMLNYETWADKMLRDMETINRDWLALPPIDQDLRAMITPAEAELASK